MRSKEEWEEFLKRNRGSFLQSIKWGEFKKNYQKVERLEARDNGSLVGVCQIFKERMPFGNYLYIPRGPVAETEEVRNKLFLEVAKKGKKEKAAFVKAEPARKVSPGKISFRGIQPERTLFVDMEESSEELMKSFSKSTRYNIRYAERAGVVIKKSDDVDSFFELLRSTKKRKDFRSYPRNYFKKMMAMPDTELFLAQYKGEIVAGLILFYFGDTAIFMHSAFDYRHRKIKAPALMRFEAMKRALERGCKRCDFRGIDEKRMPGVTKFKKGFGGREISYPKGKDIPLKRIPYFLYYLGISLKREK